MDPKQKKKKERKKKVKTESKRWIPCALWG